MPILFTMACQPRWTEIVISYKSIVLKLENEGIIEVNEILTLNKRGFLNIRK